ncbi:AAA-like domain-containing protein [Spirulina sp. 06S082]|uniref:AAA-like domain-containing protein n=1 Tax=Spirulina sp. 06S082 TaxID=3110248 RepID=UPI002B20B270|nr:AAA-like domain-containing protein [Spirulina sp. 06S082]MEA5470655.1 AAA-like domain-containing protein [Spirulina sp. 06S082]
MSKGKTHTFGDSRRSQVWQFIEVLHRQAIAVEKGDSLSADIHIKTFNWGQNGDRPWLHVETTLDAIAKLTSPRLNRDIVRAIHNFYLPKFLGILSDRRLRERGRGSEKWQFSLQLWHIDLVENKRQFELVWEEHKLGKLATIEEIEEGDRPLLEQDKIRLAEYDNLELSASSPFYINRLFIEQKCRQTLLQPGSLLRIKAPQQMGKTTLITQVINNIVREKNYRVAIISFKLADRLSTTSLDRLLRWLCANISQQLRLSLKFQEIWDEEILGSKVSCTNYFSSCFLKSEETPLILCLDDIDLLFPHTELYRDFFPLLRFWHEKSRSQSIWQRLRLIVVHSTDIYIKLNINESPFIVGVPIEIPELTSEQVKEWIYKQGLQWNDRQIEQLIDLVGGFPNLIDLAIAHFQIHRDRDFTEFLEMAVTDSGIYRNLLREKLSILKEKMELLHTIKTILSSQEGIKIDPLLSYQLQSLGLIQYYNGKVKMSCKLYHLYFKYYLGEL